MKYRSRCSSLGRTLIPGMTRWSKPWNLAFTMKLLHSIKKNWWKKEDKGDKVNPIETCVENAPHRVAKTLVDVSIVCPSTRKADAIMREKSFFLSNHNRCRNARRSYGMWHETWQWQGVVHFETFSRVRTQESRTHWTSIFHSSKNRKKKRTTETSTGLLSTCV